MTATCIQMALEDKETASVLIVADGRRDELRTLLAGARHPILWLMEGRDALSTVSQHLALYRQLGQPVRWLHWVCHGSPGILEVGAVQITADELWANRSALKLWDIDELSFWSCRYAADTKVIRQWENYTGASVFGTTLPLGRVENKLINWRLSSRDSGEQSSIPFNPVALKTWHHQLSTGAADSAGIPANSFLSVEFEKFIVKKLASKKQKRWDHKLIVSGDEQNSIWFQDRPLRNYGHFEFDSITGKKAWRNLFQDDNPNTLLSGSGQSFLFESGPFRARRNGSFVARIRALGSEKDVVTGEWNESSLLIDSTGAIVGGSVAGAVGVFLVGCSLYWYYRVYAARVVQAIQEAALENEALEDWLKQIGPDSIIESDAAGYAPLTELFTDLLKDYQDFIKNEDAVQGLVFSPSQLDTNELINGFSDRIINISQIADADEAVQGAFKQAVDPLLPELQGEIGGNLNNIAEIYADQFHLDISEIAADEGKEMWASFISDTSDDPYISDEIDRVVSFAQSPEAEASFNTIMQGGDDIEGNASQIVDSFFEGLSGVSDASETIMSAGVGADFAVVELASVLL